MNLSLGEIVLLAILAVVVWAFVSGKIDTKRLKTAIADLRDDGKLNGSVNAQPVQVVDHANIVTAALQGAAAVTAAAQPVPAAQTFATAIAPPAIDYSLFYGMTPAQVLAVNGHKLPAGWNWSAWQAAQPAGSPFAKGNDISALIAEAARIMEERDRPVPASRYEDYPAIGSVPQPITATTPGAGSNHRATVGREPLEFGVMGPLRVDAVDNPASPARGGAFFFLSATAPDGTVIPGMNSARAASVIVPAGPHRVSLWSDLPAEAWVVWR